MVRALSHSLRLIGVARRLARHDALFPLELMNEAPAALRLLRAIAGAGWPWSKKTGTGDHPDRPGVRLAHALESLGPSFIKLGQGLATRPDVVGVEVANDLSKLQDRLDPFSGSQARATIARELGAPVEQLFLEFDDQPVAAASIAQVHFAVTSDGEPVAVKVLRPEIEAAFDRDLETFMWLAQLLERAQPSWQRLRPVEVVQTLRNMVSAEMDLRLEAAAASELRENMNGNSDFLIPAVDWRRTSRRVLTTERVTGIPIGDREAIVAAGHDVKALAAKAVRAFLVQTLHDGFFHADLHHGNLFVDESGNLVAVDFGIMGRLDWATRKYLAQILYGFLKADYVRVAEVHFEAGYVPRTQSVDGFALALRSIGEPILGRPVNEISVARLLAQLFRVTDAFDMKTQPQLLLLQKTMVMIEGVAQHLDHDVNMWDISQPVIETWIRDNLGPEARLREATGHIAAMTRRLPSTLRELERAAHAIAEDGLPLDPRSARTLARAQARARRPLVMALWSIAALLATLIYVVG
ncbi:MAG: 2-polyprenylphenol 6-hydroxylase [Sphingomonadales bacterium]